MKRLLVLALISCFATAIRAQSTSGTWRDVTAAPYSVKNDCSASASSGINSAISAAPPSGTGSVVVFFPAGCYLITSQLVDTNTIAYIAYLGFGTVEIRASSSTPPSNSIIQFGNDTTTVSYRQIKNLYFNCNSQTIDGVDLDGLTHSSFDGIVIANCKGTAALRTMGSNINNYLNVFTGGTIFGTSSSNGVQLGLVTSGANSFSFHGTSIVASSSTGTGIDFEGSGGGLYGADVEGWAIGVGVVDANPGSTPAQFGGITISGTYLENNTTAIRVGYQAQAGSKGVGVTITGNYINCNSGTSTTGIQLQQANGYTITSNRIRQCTAWAVNGYGDGANAGADNGFVGANFIDGGQGILLQGSNNTVASSLATKSSNYTLTGADSWINVTGNTTITIPHAGIAQQWNVFNSGTGNVSLQCDSGTINGQTSLSLASQSGKVVTTDGTSCFAH